MIAISCTLGEQEIPPWRRHYPGCQAAIFTTRHRRLGGDTLGGRGGLTHEEAGRARRLTLRLSGCVGRNAGRASPSTFLEGTKVQAPEVPKRGRLSALALMPLSSNPRRLIDPASGRPTLLLVIGSIFARAQGSWWRKRRTAALSRPAGRGKGGGRRSGGGGRDGEQRAGSSADDGLAPAIKTAHAWASHGRRMGICGMGKAPHPTAQRDRKSMGHWHGLFWPLFPILFFWGDLVHFTLTSFSIVTAGVTA